MRVIAGPAADKAAHKLVNAKGPDTHFDDLPKIGGAAEIRRLVDGEFPPKNRPHILVIFTDRVRFHGRPPS